MPLTTKERLAIAPQKMPELAPEVRSKTMDEVAIGYSAKEAKTEALRCLNCKKPGCIEGCPVRINIPSFIEKIANEDFQGAIDKIKETSLLPAVCGRVCPQEKQCQKKCIVGISLKDVEKSVAIGRLERFVADWERENGSVKIPEVKPNTGKKVAVVGSGPASLVVAADVRREGHSVTIFEAFHKLGGVMRYGIPEFRLPNSIVDKEIETLKKMGVEFKTNFVVGRTRKLADLIQKDKFDAVFVGTGAGLPLFMGIPGEDLNGVFSANEFLTRANLMRAYENIISPNREVETPSTPLWEGKQVAVLGGGNVAMDAARIAVRLGAEKVRIIYRRTAAEMPARAEEVHHAQEEGVEFCYLQNPNKILGDEKGFVKSLLIDRYKLGDPDEKGRPRPVKLEGESFELPVDTVLVAIGNSSNPLISQGTPELKTNKRGNIEISNPETNQTFMDKVFAGGDIVLGAATVILAMGEGRRAAFGINKFLEKQ
ncbi:oxidoreductase [Fibrobacterales bacterium]|nr:oxidoreductase [Fibrobacterales bacterium]